jgi:hypothetical protein
MREWLNLLYAFLAVLAALGAYGLYSHLTAAPVPKPLTDDVILNALRKGDRKNALRWYMELHRTDLEQTSVALKQLESDLQSKAAP